MKDEYQEMMSLNMTVLLLAIYFQVRITYCNLLFNNEKARMKKWFIIN